MRSMRPVRASPPWLMSDQQTRLSAVVADAGPSSGLSLTIYGIFRANRSHYPRSKRLSQRPSHRTLIGPAIARQLLQIVFFQQIGLVIGIGPIFDPLRPDLKTRLWSVTSRFLVGPRMQLHCMRHWMRKQTPIIAFAAFMLSTGIAHAQFLFWPQYRFWPGHYAPFKHKHHHRQTNSESAKNARPEDPPKGPLQIIISIADQQVSLFDNGALIARSSVSTGTL